MASSRFFPSRIQSLYQESKLLSFGILPNGSGTPTLNHGQGVKSVSRTGAGAFTVTLQDQYRALIAAQTSLQFASAPTAVAATLTEGTGNAAILFTAGSAAAGIFGNNITVAALTDTTLATTFTLGTSSLDISVNLATGGSLASAVVTNFNAAIPANWVVASNPGTGGSNLVAFAKTALAGGTGGNLVVQALAIDVVSAKTVKVIVTDPTTGAGTDIASNAGNIINIELWLKTR